MAVLAPMPIASVSRTMTEKPGVFRSRRSAYRTSLRRVSMTAVYRGSHEVRDNPDRQRRGTDGSGTITGHGTPALSSRAAARDPLSGSRGRPRGPQARSLAVARDDKHGLTDSDRELPELFRPRAAREDLRAVAHLDLHATAIERHELFDEVEVHDVRAVHADEP